MTEAPLKMTGDPRIFVDLAFFPDRAKNELRFPPIYYLVNVPGSKDLDAPKTSQNASDALYGSILIHCDQTKSATLNLLYTFVFN
jgi:hypothetical protein